MELTQGSELEGLKAMLVSPTYGPVDPQCSRELRVAMMTCAGHGLRWAGDGSMDRMGFSASRNHSTEGMYQNPGFADGIMWVDSDIRQKADDMLRLLISMRRYDADFVTGVYHQREPLHNPVFYHYNKDKHKFQPFQEYPNGMFAPIEGCGFGFVWTSEKLIRSIAESPNFDREDGWFPDKRDSGGFGEDLSFCYQAMQLGVQLYVNTDIQVGHVGQPRVVYKEDFIRERKAYEDSDKSKTYSKPKLWGGED